ncbi:MAG: hypothetical protein ACRCYU_06040, partial [Nocardioides sp.]
KIPSGEQLRGNQIRSRHLECSVADFMALLLQVTTAREVTSEYDLVLGIELAAEKPIVIETVDGTGDRFTDHSIPLARYSKVRTAIRLDVDHQGFFDQTHTLALDAVNQGGIQIVQAMRRPPSLGTDTG